MVCLAQGLEVMGWVPILAWVPGLVWVRTLAWVPILDWVPTSASEVCRRYAPRARERAKAFLHALARPSFSVTAPRLAALLSRSS